MVNVLPTLYLGTTYQVSTNHIFVPSCTTTSAQVPRRDIHRRRKVPIRHVARQRANHTDSVPERVQCRPGAPFSMAPIPPGTSVAAACYRRSLWKRPPRAASVCCRREPTFSRIRRVIQPTRINWPKKAGNESLQGRCNSTVNGTPTATLRQAQSHYEPGPPQSTPLSSTHWQSRLGSMWYVLFSRMPEGVNPSVA